MKIGKILIAFLLLGLLLTTLNLCFTKTTTDKYSNKIIDSLKKDLYVGNLEFTDNVPTYVGWQLDKNNLKYCPSGSFVYGDGNNLVCSRSQPSFLPSTTMKYKLRWGYNGTVSGSSWENTGTFDWNDANCPKSRNFWVTNEGSYPTYHCATYS